MAYAQGTRRGAFCYGTMEGMRYTTYTLFFAIGLTLGALMWAQPEEPVVPDCPYRAPTIYIR